MERPGRRSWLRGKCRSDRSCGAEIKCEIQNRCHSHNQQPAGYNIPWNSLPPRLRSRNGYFRQQRPAVVVAIEFENIAMSSDPGSVFATSPAYCKKKRLFAFFCYKDEPLRPIACVPLNLGGTGSTCDRHVLGRCCNNRCTLNRCTLLVASRSDRGHDSRTDGKTNHKSGRY